MTMIERIIRASKSNDVRLDSKKGCDRWMILSITHSGKASYRESGPLEAHARMECERLNARAVLEAMREPTEFMHAQGHRKNSCLEWDDPLAVWQAMIDAALAEPTPLQGDFQG